MTEESRESRALGTSRRAVLFAAGAVGVGGLVAACGGDNSPAPSSNPPAGGAPRTGGVPTTGGAPTTSGAPTTGSPSAAGPAEHQVIKVADIPVGGGKIYPDRTVVVTQPTAGDFKAFDTTCPHQGCQVADVSNGRITCPCHLSQFRITDGSVERGPNTGQPLTHGLTKKSAAVNGDTITVS